jgi:hypothetical protein
VHPSCHPTLQHHNSYNRTENHRQCITVWPPDDGRKDAPNMLRNSKYGTPTRSTITVLLISKISSTCFGQTFAHLQERKTEIFKTASFIRTRSAKQHAQKPCLPHQQDIIPYVVIWNPFTSLKTWSEIRNVIRSPFTSLKTWSESRNVIWNPFMSLKTWSESRNVIWNPFMSLTTWSESRNVIWNPFT